MSVAASRLRAIADELEALERWIDSLPLEDGIEPAEQLLREKRRELRALADELDRGATG